MYMSREHNSQCRQCYSQSRMNACHQIREAERFSETTSIMILVPKLPTQTPSVSPQDSLTMCILVCQKSLEELFVDVLWPVSCRQKPLYEALLYWIRLSLLSMWTVSSYASSQVEVFCVKYYLTLLIGHVKDNLGHLHGYQVFCYFHSHVSSTCQTIKKISIVCWRKKNLSMETTFINCNLSAFQSQESAEPNLAELKYPGIVESTEEYRFVERLIPPTRVPEPPKHDKYPTPSGWRPPQGKYGGKLVGSFENVSMTWTCIGHVW